MEKEAVKPGVFLRKASGVYRYWSPIDGLIYNILAINVIVMISLTYVLSPYLFPGGNLVLAIIITGIVCTLEAIVYSMLAATMPRSGGDYVFESRIFSGAVGSIFAFTAIVSGGAMWLAVAGWFASAIITSPFLILLGSAFNIPSMVAFGQWLLTPHGMFFITVLVILWAAVINVLGMRPYALLQRWFFGIGLGAVILMVVLLIASSQAGFVDMFNQFMAKTFNTQDAYNLVINTAKGLGHKPIMPAAFSYTIAVIPLAAFALIYPAWGVAQAGEIKRGDSLRAQTLQIVGAEIFSFVVAAILAYLLISRFGSEFLSSAGFLYYEHPDQSPLLVAPFFGFFVGVMVGNPIFLLIMALLFNAWFWMWHPNITLAASRILLAMSFDRVLPEKVGDVNPRTHTPVNAIIFFSIFALIIGWLYSYTGFWRFTLATVVLNVAAFGVTCLAGALLPYRKPRLFRESPVSKYRIGGVPLITICGIIFFLFMLWLIYTLLTVDAYGVNNLASLVFMGILYIGAAALYFGFKAYRRKQQIDIGAVYEEIPVE